MPIEDTGTALIRYIEKGVNTAAAYRSCEPQGSYVEFHNPDFNETIPYTCRQCTVQESSLGRIRLETTVLWAVRQYTLGHGSLADLNLATSINDTVYMHPKCATDLAESLNDTIRIASGKPESRVVDLH